MGKTKIKIDERAKTTYIKRTKWLKDEGKMMFQTLFKTPSYRELPEIDKAVIKDLKITEDEQEQYAILARDHNKKFDFDRVSVEIRLMASGLQRMINASEYPELMESQTVEELQKLADLANELKKNINISKNKLKKKMAYIEKTLDPVIEDCKKTKHCKTFEGGAK